MDRRVGGGGVACVPAAPSTPSAGAAATPPRAGGEPGKAGGELLCRCDLPIGLDLRRGPFAARVDARGRAYRSDRGVRHYSKLHLWYRRRISLLAPRPRSGDHRTHLGSRCSYFRDLFSILKKANFLPIYNFSITN